MSFHPDEIDVARMISRTVETRSGIIARGFDLSHALGDDGMRDLVQVRQTLARYTLGLVLLSPRYLVDSWFVGELTRLLDLDHHLGGRFLIPILIGDVDDTSIPKTLLKRGIIDLRGEKRDSGLEALIDKIEQRYRELPKQPAKVFVVHGHDEASREATARFLEAIGLEAIILNDRPSLGRTIIEKFEREANVAFAVVLLTPDDVGTAVREVAEPVSRARENVWIEIGFFIGRLGRNRVCVLKKKGVVTPSDVSGLGYVELDDHGAWKALLVRELRAAQVPLDEAKVLKVTTGG